MYKSNYAGAVLHKCDIKIQYSAIPKVLYILRTAPCFSSPCLESFDQELCSIVSAVFNISLEGASTWSQAFDFDNAYTYS